MKKERCFSVVRPTSHGLKSAGRRDYDWTSIGFAARQQRRPPAFSAKWREKRFEVYAAIPATVLFADTDSNHNHIKSASTDALANRSAEYHIHTLKEVVCSDESLGAHR